MGSTCNKVSIIKNYENTHLSCLVKLYGTNRNDHQKHMLFAKTNNQHEHPKE